MYISCWSVKFRLGFGTVIYKVFYGAADFIICSFFIFKNKITVAHFLQTKGEQVCYSQSKQHYTHLW